MTTDRIPIDPAEIDRLHSLYQQLTGLAIRSDYMRVAAWAEWVRWGHTADDLRLVVAHLRRGIARGERKPAALKFSIIIGQPDRFEEELLLARASTRQRSRPAPTTREIRAGETTAMVEHDPAAESDPPPLSEALGDFLSRHRRECESPPAPSSQPPAP